MSFSTERFTEIRYLSLAHGSSFITSSKLWIFLIGREIGCVEYPLREYLIGIIGGLILALD